MPIIGFLWLYEAYKNRENSHKTIKLKLINKEVESKKLFFGISGFMGLICLIFAFSPSSFIDLENKEDAKAFTNEYLETQLVSFVKSSPNAVPKQFENKQEEYASLLISQYQPKLKKAHSQLLDFRADVIKKDALRSLLFVVLASIILYFFIYKKMKLAYFSVVFSVLMLSDLWSVATRYLNNDNGEEREYKHWITKEDKLIPYVPTAADFAILQKESSESDDLLKQINQAVNSKKEIAKLSYKQESDLRFNKLNRLTNYRVLLLSGSFSQETSISYYHKSIGGYNSTKIQRYQDILDKKIQNQLQLASNPSTLKDAKLINMLNTKYIITNPNGTGQFINMSNPATLSPDNQQITPGFINNLAMGNAWFVNEVIAYGSANSEFAALDEFNEQTTAITDTTFKNNSSISGEYLYSENAKIKLNEYRANKITYDVSGLEGDGNYYVVFSEIYYPLGWKIKIDGNLIDINRVNYTLRGVKIPAGSKKIEMYYELESFNTLSNIALASSSLIILLVLGLGYLSIYKKKDE